MFHLWTVKVIYVLQFLFAHSASMVNTSHIIFIILITIICTCFTALCPFRLIKTALSSLYEIGCLPYCLYCALSFRHACINRHNRLVWLSSSLCTGESTFYIWKMYDGSLPAKLTGGWYFPLQEAYYISLLVLDTIMRVSKSQMLCTKIGRTVEYTVYYMPSSVRNLLWIRTLSWRPEMLCLHASGSISKAISPQL